MNRPMKTLGIGAAALLLASTAAHAATLTVDASQSIVNQGSSGTVTIPTLDLSTTSFTLADLIGIRVSFSGSFSGTYTATLNAGSGGNAFASDNFITVSATPIPGTQNSITIDPLTGTNGNGFFVQLSPDSPTYSQDFGGTLEECCVPVDSANWGDYLGAGGENDFFFVFGTQNSVFLPNDTTGGSSTRFNVTGEAVYEFRDAPSVIPLPAAGWMLLSGMAGLGGLGWMRRRAA